METQTATALDPGIVIFPAGRQTRARPGSGEGAGVPLTSVRGSFGHYGPRYGKGLLFGKYEGKFWRPPTARGDAGLGVRAPDYVLRPDGQPG